MQGIQSHRILELGRFLLTKSMVVVSKFQVKKAFWKNISEKNIKCINNEYLPGINEIDECSGADNTNQQKQTIEVVGH